MDPEVDNPEEGGGFACATCGQSYSRAEYLRRHQRKHTETRPFPCANCTKTFARSDVLLRHRRRVHPVEAAEEEANKPPPPPANPAKKPSATRRRNRNAHRPYPASYKAGVAAEAGSEAEEEGGDSPEDLQPPTAGASSSNGVLASPANGSSNAESPTSSRPRLGLDASEESLAEAAGIDISLISDLQWSGPSQVPGSGSSSSASPFFLDQNDISLPSPSSPTTSNTRNSTTNSVNYTHELSLDQQRGYMPVHLDPSSEDYRNVHAERLIQLGIPPASTLTSLEAGVGSWATSARDMPLPDLREWQEEIRRSANGPQPTIVNSSENHFGSDTIGLPSIPASVTQNLDPYLTEQMLNLPFVPPPNPNDPEEQQKAFEMVQYLKTADFSTLKEKVGMDIFETEYAMIDSESRLRHSLSGALQQGAGGDPASKFYIPPGLFAGCYTVPHWLLPPLQRLSVFAANSFKNILCHLGMIHEPTFRLADAHAWIAFSLCTAACHKPFRVAKPGAYVDPEPWDAVNSVVRTEKTGMFVKLFARAGSKLPAAETFSGIQAMLIYNAQSFLSDNQSDRIVGDLFLSTISKVGRRSGIFETDREWAKPWNFSNPNGGGVWGADDIGVDWRRWVRGESCRRTAWLVYLTDTQSSLESCAAPLVSPRDVKHLPIPCSPIIWNARSAVQWAIIATQPANRSMTLDDAMQKLFDFSADLVADANGNGNGNPRSPSSPESFSTPSSNSASPPSFPNLNTTLPDTTPISLSPLEQMSLGPFARLMIIITILRGIVEYGEGKHRGGYVVQRWITGGQNGHMTFAYTKEDGTESSEEFHQFVMRTFGRVLIRWKNGWDFDMLCPKDRLNEDFLGRGDPDQSTSDGPCVRIFNQDAMPFWWMAQLLLNHMNTSQSSPNGNDDANGSGSPPSPSASSGRRWEDDLEEGEGKRRLTDLDMGGLFQTARSIADPYTSTFTSA